MVANGGTHGLAFHPDRDMAKERDRVMTITELSEYLKISKSTLYKLAQEGKLPSQKVGRHWRFRKETIDRWLDARHRDGRDRLDHHA